MNRIDDSPGHDSSCSDTNDSDESTPAFLRIARELRDAIFAGDYPVGSNLPTEASLSRRFGVSRNTVREALRKLREEKLIQSRRGSGSRILPPQSGDSNFLHAMSINDLQSYAEGWDFNIDFIELTTLHKDFAGWLGVPAEAKWLAIKGLSRTHGAKHPECWVQLFVHRDFAALGRLVATHRGPVFKLIEDLFGETVIELTQEISAELVGGELARMLEVEDGSPAVVVRRAFRAVDGRIVEAALETYPAARFRYQVNLHRSDGRPSG